jgi:protein-S-isoprenylcysteine O-methyltransferase Ste14
MSKLLERERRSTGGQREGAASASGDRWRDGVLRGILIAMSMSAPSPPSAPPAAHPPGATLRALGLAYALAAFLAALALFLYAIPFLGNLGLLKRLIVYPSVDFGPQHGVAWAALMDVGLILLFGLQHSLMAREFFKRWLTRNLPQGLERATYVHASNLTLWPVLLFWQPIPAVLVDLSGVRAVMSTIFWLGWLIVLLSSLNIDLAELWGLRQARSWSRGEVYAPPPFKASWLYRLVRHPIYLGLLVAFWATPQLTVGHALFAGCMSAYILIGTRFEERDLVHKHGPSYREYQHKVPALIPGGRRRLAALVRRT